MRLVKTILADITKLKHTKLDIGMQHGIHSAQYSAVMVEIKKLEIELEHTRMEKNTKTRLSNAMKAKKLAKEN